MTAINSNEENTTESGQINDIYRYINLTSGCIVLIDELKKMANEDGIFDLNIAIKRDIGLKYGTNKYWVNTMLNKIVKLRFIVDMGMGRYQLNLSETTIALLEGIQQNTIEEVVFQITLRPHDDTKIFKLVSFESIDPPTDQA